MDKPVTYIALLRGINVGGHRPLKMEDLRGMFSRLGFESVSTYIQSGNVIFDATAQDEDELVNVIQKEIKNTFGYDVPVIIYAAVGLKKILERFPFDEKDGWRGYITFLSSQPGSEQQEKLEALSSEIETFKVATGAVYVHVDKRTDEKPLFSSNFIQKKLNIKATNRNMRTIHKILEMVISSE